MSSDQYCRVTVTCIVCFFYNSLYFTYPWIIYWGCLCYRTCVHANSSMFRSLQSITGALINKKIMMHTKNFLPITCTGNHVLLFANSARLLHMRLIS